jgi:hypothetical protein
MFALGDGPAPSAERARLVAGTRIHGGPDSDGVFVHERDESKQMSELVPRCGAGRRQVPT